MSKLSVSKVEAELKIKEQIVFGKNLDKKEIVSPDDHYSLKRDFIAWDNTNKNLLKAIFVDDILSKEYELSGFKESQQKDVMCYDDPRRIEYISFKIRLRFKIEKLEDIFSKLELYVKDKQDGEDMPMTEISKLIMGIYTQLGVKAGHGLLLGNISSRIDLENYDDIPFGLSDLVEAGYLEIKNNRDDFFHLTQKGSDCFTCIKIKQRDFQEKAVSSTNQSGGVTAQNIIFNQHHVEPPKNSEPKWTWVFYVIAAIIAILTYFNIFPLNRPVLQNETMSQAHFANLNIFLEIKKYVNEGAWVRILVINDGDSPIMISRCEYFMYQNDGKGDLGVYDQLKETYGSKIVLPAIIQPAGNLVLNFVPVESIEQIKSIVLVDNHEKKYEVPKNELMQIKDEYKSNFKI